MKITKEQVRKLYNMVEMHGYDYIQPIIKEWFPKAFKPKLEVGKWYKGKDEQSPLICITRICPNSVIGYGFTISREWRDSECWFSCNLDRLTPASSIDVERALLKEAEKRGYKKGVAVISLAFTDVKSKITDFWKFDSYGEMWFNGDDYNIVVFKSGKWAEIIESTPATKLTVAEIESKLGYKIEVISEP